jgi:hypothetical protein
MMEKRERVEIYHHISDHKLLRKFFLFITRTITVNATNRGDSQI